ncbi:hypothetical protein LUW75_10730 [Streptomyces sp. MRC013]|uniref:hypothetical protein n=1 Tax=Streptomyces sp. MRC013 TaxID=2898276 RepID=UPI002025EC24|nr:hypothetical protein [Streptomyces sp. MRC013]URM90389.1 hypothetical protein LUW75_10730 [Streptomyces sp. MRC013]
MTEKFRDWLGQNRHLSAMITVFTDTPGAWTTADELHTELHRRSVDSRECIYLAAAKDAWLAAVEQWEYDCADCGTDSTNERYMVHDHVWAAAGMCPFGFLCIGCLEVRLGRSLNAADFLNVPLNHAPGYRRSERLAARLASRT